MSNIKKELDFTIDNFQNQKVFNDLDSIANIILNLLFMKPGNIPNLPHIGINIKKYLYSLEDGIDVDELKNDIYNQCNAIIPYISIGEVQAVVTEFQGRGILLIIIPIESIDKNNILIGFSTDENNDVIFNYEIDNSLLNTK